jgi:hypothetical protein
MLIRGEPRRIEQFRKRLMNLLEKFKAETSGLDPSKTDAYGLTLAFYPAPANSRGNGSAAASGKPAETRRDPEDGRFSESPIDPRSVKTGKVEPKSKSLRSKIRRRP